MPMTDRARLVYALLRTLLAWAPAPRSRSGLDAVPRGFAGGSLRYVSCPDCLTNDRVLAGCETCHGRGEVPDPGPDPYETKKSTRFAGVAGERQADRHRQIDDELRRLEFQLGRPIRKVDEQVGDLLTRSVELRDRLYRHGSYAELEHALAKLRDCSLTAYSLAMTVAYQPFGEAPVEALAPAVVAVCEQLALWIDGPVRVPESVAVSTDEELERVAREGKGALWHGKQEWHRMKRGERNALILTMSRSGMSATAIGLRVGLRRRRIQDILAEHRAAAAATGPAA